MFKPKDEEPYGRLNPKVRVFLSEIRASRSRSVQTTKWLHRQFRWIIPFGRACLIPNLRYADTSYNIVQFFQIHMCVAISRKRLHHYSTSGWA